MIDSQNQKKRSPKLTTEAYQWMKPYRRQYLSLCFLGLVVAALEVVPPKIVGSAIDTLALREAGQSFSMKPVLLATLAWLGITVMIQVLHGFQISLASRTGETVLSNLRMKLFDHLQRLPVSYFDRTHVGRILSTQTADLDGIKNLLCWGLNTVVSNLAILVLSSTMLFLTDRTLFFWTAWLFPTMAVLNAIYGKKVTRAWERAREHSSTVGANQVENINGVRVVAAFNRQRRNLVAYNELQDENTRNNVEASRTSGAFAPLMLLVNFTGLAIILVAGGYRTSQGDLRPGDLVALLLYWDWFMRPASTFGTLFNDILVARSAAERLVRFLNEKAESEVIESKPDLPPIHGEITLDQVGFQYSPGGKQVLRDVSLHIPAGSRVAVVGETGSGKSTLLSLLTRFYTPTQGQISIDGVDLSQVSKESYQRQIGIVLQSNFLFAGTLMENLRYAKPDATDEEVFKATRMLRCHRTFLNLKNGYDTQVGERGSALSLGQRQLVCLARALVANPRILLMDEATSALDPRTGLQVQRALQTLAKGRTSVVVTHRLSTIHNSDIIVMVKDGRILAHGSHEELLESCEDYQNLYRHSLPSDVESESSGTWIARSPACGNAQAV